MTNVLRRGVGPALLAAVAAGLGGCGGVPNPVAGRVVRDGRPVPTGIVRFTPDLDKGNDGPSVVLSIRDGQFSSARDGLAMRPGEHKVLVVVPGVGTGELIPSEDHDFRADIPVGGTTDLLFDVTKRPAPERPKRR
jgi:hypothetical protein